MGEGVMKVLPHSLNADVAHRAGKQKLCLGLEIIGRNFQLGICMVGIMFHKVLQRTKEL